jgi:imidazole glycerol-phosphate synthase subunit HisH
LPLVSEGTLRAFRSREFNRRVPGWHLDMIAVIDFGAGNLGSVHKALKYVSPDVVVTADPEVVERADKLVLPGVGAFCHCMEGLAAVRLTEVTRGFIRSGRPFLGICVGLQMLFDESEEMGASAGLGVLGGKVVRFDSARMVPDSEEEGALKVPHIGWNSLHFRDDAPLFAGLDQGERVYFVHSYHPEPTDETVVTATADYGYRFCCAVQESNVHAVQFHPEKSGAVGLHILRNFTSLPS